MAPSTTDWTLPIDRRGAFRYTIHFPIKVVEEDGVERLGMCRDMSCTGGVLMTQAPLEVGQRVKVSLYLTHDHTEAVTLGAQVVRVDKRPIYSQFWKYEAAMRFDLRLIELEPEIAQKSEEQRLAGLH